MSEDILLGRLAVHYKMISGTQLNELTLLHARSPGKRIGDLMVQERFISGGQLQQLLKVQQEYVRRKRAAATNPGTPESEVRNARDSVAPPVMGSETVPSSVPRTVTPKLETAGGTVSASSGASGQTEIDVHLREAVELGASDIHFHAHSQLRRRVNGVLSDAGTQPFTPEQTKSMTYSLLSDRERQALEEHGQIDFAYAIDGVARFRCNAYRQQTGIDLVMRAISAEPPTLQELGLPADLARFTDYHQGLVLLTGPAGSGKSSTMAALVSIINEKRLDHIITVEDPIEFVHVNKRCVVNQRQVGPHTMSFARALKGALREDPDIIALGELRDLETISLALTAAETGHLVLATLHTGNAIRTVNRLIGVFPPNQQAQIRTMVSESLRAVVSQRLIPRADGHGRVPALEILVTTKAIGNTIRDNKTFQLRSALQTGAAQGMKLLDNSLAELVRTGVVKREDAIKQADDPQKFPG